MPKLANIAFGLMFVCVCVAGAAARGADQKIDVTGTWDVEIELNGAQGAPVFTFKQDGEKLTGKYKGQFGEEDVTGKIKGNEIEFSFTLQGAAKAVYTGTIEKDTMKGKANYADQATGDWTAKRQKIDVTGTWNVEIEINDMQGAPVFTFKQEGEKLTGKYKGQFGEADVTGKVKGTEIEFSFPVEGVGKAVYTGTIEKDSMKGKANYADQASGTWTAKKKPAE
jgi:hypothetical protein